MNPIIQTAPVPESRNISAYLPGASFADCYVLQTPHTSTTAFDIYLAIMSQPPAWFDVLMTIRNRIVGIFGIKSLGGALPQATDALQPGDPVGIFSLVYLSDDEIVLEDCDKHLDVRLSVCKLPDNTHAAISTVVQVHNWLGRAYMFFVGPVHKLIVPIMLRRSLTAAAKSA